MESQLQRSSHDHHHQYEEDPQNAGLHSVIEGSHEGDQEHQQGEKKSVLKKVKDKAKKIKDTIKKHGHHHGHEHEHDDDEGEDDDNDDEEMATPSGKEVEVSPLSQFKNLNVDNASKSKPELEERPHTGSHDQFTSQPTPTENQLNLKSSDRETQDFAKSEDKSQETIAGKISSAATAVAGTAISAKNAVATKLGYGGRAHEGPVSSSREPVTESATEYAHKMVEKLSPGDEDKALSEAITDRLGKKKGEEEKKPMVGKVTESEEVRSRLGPAEATKREGEDALVSGAESSGQGVVDRFKDAFGSWLGKSAGVQTAQDSVGKSYVSDPSSGGTGVGKGKDAGQRPNEE